VVVLVVLVVVVDELVVVTVVVVVVHVTLLHSQPLAAHLASIKLPTPHSGAHGHTFPAHSVWRGVNALWAT
jgi:hypothetical protein